MRLENRLKTYIDYLFIRFEESFIICVKISTPILVY